MGVAENAEVLGKHYKEVVKEVKDPTPLYLPEAGKLISNPGLVDGIAASVDKN
jgi:hypothetical protein